MRKEHAGKQLGKLAGLDFTELARNGGIALAASLALLFIGAVAVNLPKLMEVYMSFSDVGETISSIKVLSQYGFLQKVPNIGNGTYTIFGSTPPLYPFLGSIFYAAIGDAAISAFMLNIALGIIAAYLLARNSYGGWQAKALAIAVILFSAYTGIMFPFAARARSLLALVFFLALIYMEKKGMNSKLTYFCGLLGMFLSQPVIGVMSSAILGWRALVERKEMWKLVSMAIVLAIALAFSYKLLLASGTEPKSLAGSFYDVVNPALIPIYVAALAGFALATDRKDKYKSLPAFAMLALPLANSMSYIITGRLDSTLFEMLPFASDFIYAAFFTPAAAFLVCEYGAKIEKNGIAAGLLFAVAGLGMGTATVHVLAGAENFADRMALTDMIAADASKILATQVVEDHGRIYNVQGDFMLSGLMIASGKNISFVGHVIPPLLDKGPAFVAALKLANCEYVRDCKEFFEAVGNADMLIYITNSPELNKKLDVLAERCKLEKKEYGTSYGGAIAAYSIPTK